MPAQVHVWQPERCWILQLEHSHDVPAQLEAVAALAALPHASPAAIASLKACLYSPETFCRRVSVPKPAKAFGRTAHVSPAHGTLCQPPHASAKRTCDFALSALH